MGERLFAPAGGVVLAMGITMVINSNRGCGKFWVDIGLVGYALSMAIGMGVLSPRRRRSPSSRRRKARRPRRRSPPISRILLVARFDVAILLLVVADMVTKPFS